MVSIMVSWGLTSENNIQFSNFCKTFKLKIKKLRQQKASPEYTFSQRRFFIPSGSSSLPPNVVYRSKPTKSCTPTLGGQKTIKCLNNFDWDCSLLKAKASKRQDELGECTRLIFLMECSTKLNLENDILPDMPRISLGSNFPRFLV